MITPAAVPAGFEEFQRYGPYAAQLGPFYLCHDDRDGWRYALPLEERHTNPTGITHGGALYGFADHLMGHNIVHNLGRMCATIKLKVEFMGASRPGQLVEGSCRIIRTTRTMAFLRATLSSGGQPLMSADGVYKLGPENDLDSLRERLAGGADHAEAATRDVEPAPVPAGFKPYRTQGNFAALYGPMLYRRDGEDEFVCGIATGGRHDNSTGVIHGGVVFAFADDLLGRTVSASARRYSATVCLDIQYHRPAALGSWLSGRAEVIAIDDDYAQVRTDVYAGDETVASAQGLWRLFGRYD
jgi:uncharacterized protein (TIGR00369 family)